MRHFTDHRLRYFVNQSSPVCVGSHSKRTCLADRNKTEVLVPRSPVPTFRKDAQCLENYSPLRQLLALLRLDACCFPDAANREPATTVAAPLLRPAMDRLRNHNPRIRVLDRAIRRYRLQLPPQRKTTHLRAVRAHVLHHLAARAHVRRSRNRIDDAILEAAEWQPIRQHKRLQKVSLNCVSIARVHRLLLRSASRFRRDADTICIRNEVGPMETELSSDRDQQVAGASVKQQHAASHQPVAPTQRWRLERPSHVLRALPEAIIEGDYGCAASCQEAGDRIGAAQ
ncbi:hypothetical protein EC9_22890 [Rosistilla ulvae]|uniref:Uncharacterized protein n=1 Tax=Rosistilla ulvae TaxID=1930277 RepID=A0A517LZQ4_9BACT|nr:hypothetical protein EC9_22890 [Rosistilla ulvae]